ncbi:MULTISPECIES: hypothetical protein [Streptomyces]|uniref:Uncharacterized protein n=2 Tax=Streptomyces TaxID=1883 RepID=A0A100Y1B1_9ACTN|nr:MULTISPECIES: hypothetical protein [Streptomyces]KUH35852.1 hypothetical protein ATE80_26785 [Streptomyces kanasensis]UUS31203.1 hypothetical protein NRO40_10365 [Streptomyces changanensis]
MLTMNALPHVPRWAVLAAHAVPLVTLPSGLWRIALAAGLPVAEQPVEGGWEIAYVVGLSVLSELLALLTLGLVQGWGEVVPRWVPLLGGRGVRPLAAVVPALLGAAGLTGLAAYGFYAQAAGLGDGSIGTPAQDALLLVCYLPLLTWPPLLVAVTVAYHRRRRHARLARWA